MVPDHFHRQHPLDRRLLLLHGLVGNRGRNRHWNSRAGKKEALNTGTFFHCVRYLTAHFSPL